MLEQETFSDRLRGYFPIINWLPAYEKQWLRPDIIAGTTLAAFTIPEAIAYADLAGMPSQAGLYACIAAPLLYMLFGTSRQLVVGPTSAVSILVASALGSLTLDSPAQYAALASLTAILVGLIAFLAYSLRLGVLMNFISESVLVGFSTGAAFYIAGSQLGKLFGIHGAQGQFLERITHLVHHIGETNLWALAFGVSAIVVIVAGEHWAPKMPWPLMTVLGSIGLMTVVDPKVHGIDLVGAIPSGLPEFSIPPVFLPDVRDVIRGAVAIFVLAYVEGMSMARTFALKNGYSVNPNQELLALGFASIGTGLTQSYPVAGSFSRSALNDQTGAKTQLAGGFSAVLVAMVVMFLTGLFSRLPEPILAAVVIVAIKGLFKWKQLSSLFELRTSEFWTALGALVGVVFLGILDGVMIGALLSLLLMIGRTSQSHISLLGRVPGQPQFSSIQENPENITIPGMLIIRADTGIFYVNADSFKSQIISLVRESDPPIEAVVFDMEMTGDLDLAGAEMLAGLHKELVQIGISLRLSRVQLPARTLLDRLGITKQIGEENFHARTLLAVAQYLVEEGLSKRMTCDILPDLVKHVYEMVCDRANRVEGEEQQRLDHIRLRLEAILRELDEMSCEVS
jgi:high affinity sulfate transporter 1